MGQSPDVSQHLQFNIGLFQQGRLIVGIGSLNQEFQHCEQHRFHAFFQGEPPGTRKFIHLRNHLEEQVVTRLNGLGHIGRRHEILNDLSTWVGWPTLCVPSWGSDMSMTRL